jgi:hypothetical protein
MEFVELTTMKGQGLDRAARLHELAKPQGRFQHEVENDRMINEQTNCLCRAVDKTSGFDAWQ